MKLIYLTANSAWVFAFGQTIIQLDGHARFFPESWGAIKAAQERGLAVDINTGLVTTAPRGWDCITGGDTA